MGENSFLRCLSEPKEYGYVLENRRNLINAAFKDLCDMHRAFMIFTLINTEVAVLSRSEKAAVEGRTLRIAHSGLGEIYTFKYSGSKRRRKDDDT